MGFNPYFSIAKRLLRLRKKPMLAHRLGANWELYPSDWIDNRLLIGRPFERTQLDFAQTCIDKYKIDTFFDCGANMGLYSVVLGTRLPELTHIHSFEPVDRTYARLVKNLSLNNLQDTAKAHNFGLGDVAGHFEIVIEENSSGTASLDPNVTKNPRRNFQLSQKIDIRTFDSQFQNTDVRAFFKIDVEGHEAAALRGMKNFLEQNICILQIELWDEHKDNVTAWLAKCNYELFHEIDNDFYFRSAP